jgi:hypothetical protein
MYLKKHNININIKMCDILYQMEIDVANENNISENAPTQPNHRCQHNKLKNYCVLCGGINICEHNQRRSFCYHCNIALFCEHRTLKKWCKKCYAVAICKHDILESKCKDCRPDYCQHRIRRSYCLQCGPNACEHKKLIKDCKECNSSAFCQHGVRKYYCIDCSGQGTCEHKKLKKDCKLCGGSRFCRSPYCETSGNKKYDNYCLFCYVHLYPDKPNVRNYKTKETEVVGRIKTAFPDFTWITDRKVQDGCSRRRPDLLLDMGSHIIIVEIDENRHNDYDCSCEHKRLMELSQDLQHRPIIFIRFNPDSYTNQDGLLVTSCWRSNKMGVMQIMKSKIVEWETRINSLKDQIQYWVDNPTEKMVEIVELFY